MTTTATQTNEESAQGNGQLARLNDQSVVPVPQLRAFFDNCIDRIRQALPPNLQRHAERIASCAVMEVQKRPELLKCTAYSILAATLQAAHLGFEIGGPLGRCYMVPYGNQAVCQLGYKGMIDLVGAVGATAYAEVVREKDKFRIIKGTSPGIDHEQATSNAGPVIGAYAVVIFANRQINYEWMTREEIEYVRHTFSKQPHSLMWKSAWNEGAKKTVLRKLLKYCPLRTQLPKEVFDEPEEEAITDGAEVATTDTPALPVAADKTEAETESKPEEQKPSDNGREEDSVEVTDDKAFLSLLDRKKGITWASAIGKVNARFKTEYDGATPFEEIAIEHRRWVVEVIGALDDLPAKKK